MGPPLKDDALLDSGILANMTERSKRPVNVLMNIHLCTFLTQTSPGSDYSEYPTQADKISIIRSFEVNSKLTRPYKRTDNVLYTLKNRDPAQDFQYVTCYMPEFEYLTNMGPCRR